MDPKGELNVSKKNITYQISKSLFSVQIHGSSIGTCTYRTIWNSLFNPPHLVVNFDEITSHSFSISLLRWCHTRRYFSSRTFRSNLPIFNFFINCVANGHLRTDIGIRLLLLRRWLHAILLLRCSIGLSLSLSEVIRLYFVTIVWRLWLLRGSLIDRFW